MAGKSKSESAAASSPSSQAASNPDLEAAIVENPNDIDGYLVYGDWLTEQGDPRGELISLQAAQLRNPKDSEINKAVDKYMATHAASLLGEKAPLARYVASKDIEWHLGFIESVRIETKTVDEAEVLLSQLLHHPSGRFIRSLTITGPKNRSIDPKPFVKILLEEQQPKTLTDLHIGAPGVWDVHTDGAELVKVFPRLLKSLYTVWQDIMTEVTEQKRMDPKYDPAEFPDLVTLRDIDIGKVDKALILKGLKMEIDKGKDIGLVRAMRRAFTPASLDRFAVAFGDQFTKLGETSGLRWGYLAMGAIGHDEAAEWIGTRLRSWSHQRAVQGAELLGKIGSGVAIYELYGLVSDSSAYRSRRTGANVALQETADKQGLNVNQLLDRLAPTAVLPGSLERVRDAVKRRFEGTMMIEGRRMKAHDFRHYIVEHPFIAPLASRVVFATYSKSAPLDLFRIGDHGALIDASGDEVEIDDRTIGVVHPAEIEDVSDRQAAQAAWKKVFAKHKIEPLFLQLDRPVYELRENEADASEITRFKLRRGEFDRMRRVMEYERDWYVYEEQEHGGVADWARDFKRDNITMIAELGSYGSTIERLHMLQTPGSLAKKLSPVTISELLYDVETATTKPKPEPAAAKKKATTSRGAANALANAKIEAEDGQPVTLDDEEEEATSSSIEKGSRVRVAKGNEARTKQGVVFWIGEKNGTMRAGMRADDGKTHWVDLANLALAGAADAAPPQEEEEDDEEEEAESSGIEKGAKVSWDNGRHSGTGFVFWLGPNKFGGGTRAGVKDDETGETVWLDVTQCSPLAG